MSTGKQRLRALSAEALPDWTQMVRACRRLSSEVTELVLPECQIGILQIRPYQMKKGWSIRPHEHSFYEFNLILAGEATDDGPARQRLSPGHVYFHGPSRPHSWAAPRGNCLRLIVWFTLKSPVPVAPPARWPCWPEMLSDTALLLRYALEMKPGWRDQAAARLSVMLTRVLTLADLPRVRRKPLGTADQLVERVDSFLRGNLARPMQLEDIAAAAGVSESSLTHRFRKLTGQSVGRRLLALRMTRAAELLATTDDPLKKICLDVGIVNAAYLCRLFQRFFRMSPGAYRAKSARRGAGPARRR